MPKATLSILGLYNYDNSIFDDMHLPTALIDRKDEIKEDILLECAEFEILYPDSDFMKFAIRNWSEMETPVWEHLYETTQYDYNPIYNYDRTEKWTDEDTRQITNDRTADLKDELTHGHTITNAQNSYENAGFVDGAKQTNAGKDSTTTTGTDKYLEKHSGKVFRDGHSYGNIGITSSQNLIKQEREIAEFNIITRIVDDFKMRFCLMVY